MDTIDRLIRDIVGISGEGVDKRRRVVAECYVNQLINEELEKAAQAVTSRLTCGGNRDIRRTRILAEAIRARKK